MFLPSCFFLEVVERDLLMLYYPDTSTIFPQTLLKIALESSPIFYWKNV